jgi:hypothetical protein
MTGNFPRSRRDLIVKELENELLVYDEKSKKAFCLNASSALIWKMCDGATTVAEISERTARSLGMPIDDTFVSFALERLRVDDLLEPGFHIPAETAAVTRAQVMRRIGRVGVAAAVAVPLVTVIMAPTPAKAYGEGLPTGDPIGSGCVLYSTEILRADGTLASARHIAEGDLLFGVRADTGEFVPGTVASVRQLMAPGFYTFVAESGDVVGCSPTHTLIRGFGDCQGTQAVNLKMGDPLLVHDARTGRAVESPIATASYSKVPQPVLLFEMDTDEHTYFAGGIASHNKQERL